MHAFTDAAGRQWPLVLTVSTIKRLRDVLAVDLLEVAGGNLLNRLADDPCLLVDVIYVIAKPEADAKNVSDEEFGKGMVGNVLDEAASALMKELLDFFPRAQRVRALGSMARKAAELEAECTAALRAIDSMRGPKSGDSPASAGSTPDPAR